MKKDKLTARDMLSEEHFAIVDEYFNNGYRQDLAVMAYRPHLKPSTASSFFSAIMKRDDVREYVLDKRAHLRAKANIEPEQVISELITWVYSDPTQFIGLTADEVKALPPETKRCIQTINHKKNKIVGKDGEERVNEIWDIKLVDKNKAIEILNKMLGFYALDNRQKQSVVNVESLNVNELKVLQQILTPKE
jgi:hypothetical protein